MNNPVTETPEALSDDGVLAAPAEWFGGAQRVLFVHAHPDDETLTTGGTLAGLAAAGLRPAVLTLTRGERGEVVEGPLSALAGTPELAAQRERELAAALATLGVPLHAYLGSGKALAEGQDERIYADSGMRWAEDGRATFAEDAAENALTRSPAHLAIADAIEWVVNSEATAIVSYDAAGGYGHPDHVFAHLLARAVAHGLELPFWTIVPEVEVLSPADRIAAVGHDVREWLPTQFAALACHETQVTVGEGHVVHTGGQRQIIPGIEVFLREGR